MVVQLEAFKKGDVYIDYAFEDAKFRYEKQTGKVFRRFDGKAEDEIGWDSDLYKQAILSGQEITRDEYYADATPARARLARERITYQVGSRHSPGDPLGAVHLLIEPDGHARLDRDSRGGTSSLTGRVNATALDRIWTTLQEAGFPAFPMLPPPAGSAMRNLTVGAPPKAQRVFLPYHARAPGYDTAFALLDGVIRQLSETATGVPAVGERLVEINADRPVTQPTVLQQAPTEEERTRARAALRVPADSIDVRLVAPDGSFVLYLLSRNVTEVPDPDAGSVVWSDPAFALWDRVREAWRWETHAAPPEYTIRYTAECGEFTLSFDGTGLFVKPGSYPTSTQLYDVATGNLRAPGPGDYPPVST